MTTRKKIPVVWSIGHSDSSGGTGIQADIHTFHDFNVYGCNVVTAIVAQNSFAAGYSIPTERKGVIAQINALDSDLPASVIKVGMLPNEEVLETVAKYLADFKGFVLYDLELEASDSWLLGEFGQLKVQLLPHVGLFVVNTDEAAALAGRSIESVKDLKAVAQTLHAAGPEAVLITGARFAGADGQRFDLWFNGSEERWVSIDVVDSVNNRGGGSTMSAALAAAMARGDDLDETIRVAKAYVTRGIRNANSLGSGPGSVSHTGLPLGSDDWPTISIQPPAV